MKKNNLFASRLFYFFLHIVLFFYIYSIQFIGAPFGIGTRVFIGIIGFLIFFYDIIKIKNDLIIKKSFLKLTVIFFSISIISFLTILYNKTTDFEFLFYYQASIIVIFFASYLVIKLISLKTRDLDEVPVIFSLIINVVIIQIIIALIMFSIQPVRDLLNSIQVTSDFELKVLEETLEFRLVGFGSKFFGSGIINGFTLIIIGTILKLNHKINVFKYTICFLIIFVFGMMMARTTIVGAIFALAIILAPTNIFTFNVSRIKMNFKFLFYLILIPLSIYIGISLFFPEVNESLEFAFNFGFEIFINYFKADTIETESTNQLKEMFFWPSEFKTYLIGDGLFSDTINGGYYKGTDVGILRLIYYFGIFGLFAYLIFQLQVIYIAISTNRKYRVMFLVIFLYCIALNFKGFTDIFFLVILFVFQKPLNAKKQTPSYSHT